MSMILTPASNSVRACCMATPLGVAKNTTSHCFNAVSEGALKSRSTWPRRFGNMAATGVPASCRDVMTFSSQC